MGTRIKIEKTLKQLKTSEFTLNCKMDMGYNVGYPILQIKNDSLCMMVPFVKYKVTGKVDKTLVYPIRYTITVELPEEKIVEFSNLEYKKKFRKIDFDKPVGLFRHDSIKDLTKAEYQKKRKELYSYYDKLANSLIYGSDFTQEDEQKMKELLQLLVEPSLYKMYQVLDKNFYNRFLA